MSSENENLINALETRAIRRGLQISGDEEVDPNWSRNEVLAYLDTNPSKAPDLREDIIEGAKRFYLSRNHVKPNCIEGAGPETGIEVLSDSLTLREASYYESYFKYADHTAHVYKITEFDGLLESLCEADTKDEVQTELESQTEAQDDLEEYAAALNDLPAPLIGNVEDSYKPRVVQAETSDVIYVEFWKKGSKSGGFDVRTGDYKTIQGPYRAVLRVDLDNQTIEAVGDNSSNTHEGLVKRFMIDFNESASFDFIHINSGEIEDARRDLAFIATLDEFLGDAKLRFTVNESSNVEADPAHGSAKGTRDLGKSNFRVLMGENGTWERIVPREYPEIDEEDENELSLNDLLKDLQDDSGYHDVLDVTIGMNSEKNSYRIQKKAINPTTRKAVFDSLANQIGW
ncbi:hypothetical protein C482_02441 [Natrialba chahannaoensis JCM 10990]|uniref:Uncharacterized protein n=1 Tax=Natrialba chahannaoensis JCM 10990 TaxID=1227492 RepID=M0B4B5_9EURY|nr:hypothetical protein [Natrialba chahannaoensis]ELZ05372.1 hypothetical protein C482_02441 [Natrialba chahannaoensis JCM 10990]